MTVTHWPSGRPDSRSSSTVVPRTTPFRIGELDIGVSLLYPTALARTLCVQDERWRTKEQEFGSSPAPRKPKIRPSATSCASHAMPLLDLAAFHAAPLVRQPFEFLV